MSEANPFADGAAFIEGEYVPIAEARIPILDWGFTRSDVTYDVVHVWKGSFFRLEDHLNRFERSVAAKHMTLPHSRQSLREVLAECVRLGGLREAFVEMVCTRGVPPRGRGIRAPAATAFSPTPCPSSGSPMRSSAGADCTWLSVRCKGYRRNRSIRP